MDKKRAKEITRYTKGESMIRATTRYYVDKAVEDELHYIVRDKPLYHSGHEAYAILMEEWEELADEVWKARDYKDKVWAGVKDESDDKTNKAKADMLSSIKNVISEAVQVAAVLEKFSVRKGEDE